MVVLPLAQTQSEPPAVGGSALEYVWIASTILSSLALIATVVYCKLLLDKKEKAIKFEEYRADSLRKRLKLALNTIKKMETNPDLVHSREFNLDYLRMRMEEQGFREVIVNQVKVCVKQLVTIALRPDTSENNAVGIASTGGRHINRVFDVFYETELRGKRSKGVLFRIQVKIVKMPTQATSATIAEMIECIEKFLNPRVEDYVNWQPTLQGYVVNIRWDQTARPTPLLVFEQTDEGSNISFRSSPQATSTSASAKSLGEQVPSAHPSAQPLPKVPYSPG